MSRHKPIGSLCVCAMVVLLAACGRREAAPVTAGTAPAGIEWRAGSVEDAFAEAKATGRPLLLFWGAAWCPYCQQLKSAVFTRRDFIEKSRLFVAVELDGDTAGAQKWGESLAVSGYPTLLILSPDGIELMRVAGGMDVERYGELLDLALADTRPVADILAGLPAAQALSADDCRRLAYHGFVLETGPAMPAPLLASRLRDAAGKCPATAQVERDRLTVMAMTTALGADRDVIRAGQPATAATAEAVARVVALLAEPERAVAVADTLFLVDSGFFTEARRSGLVDDDALEARWFTIMDRAAVDPRFSESDRFFALTSKLLGAKALSGLTADMTADARARVDAALDREHDAATRASVVNALLYVMDALDDTDRVYAIAAREMATASAPYYLMLELAGIDEKRGRTAEALGWLERAYRESAGPATRFQWGTSWVAGLIRMQPEDEARIRAATLEVLAELDGPDRLYQRTNARIARLERDLVAWNARGTRVATLAAIRDRMQQVCRGIPEAETAAKQACEGFVRRVATGPEPDARSPV